jgi:hypothetical protein
VSAYEIVTVFTGMPGGSPTAPAQGQGTADCPPTKRVLGGGYRMQSGGSADFSAVVAIWNSPLDGGAGWFFIGANRNPTAIGVYIYAICAVVQ